MKRGKIISIFGMLVILCAGLLVFNAYAAAPKPGSTKATTVPVIKYTDVKIDNVYTTDKTECPCPCSELDWMDVFIVNNIHVYLSNQGSNPATGTIKVSYTNLLNNMPVTNVQPFSLLPSTKGDYNFGISGLIRKSKGVKVEVVLSGTVVDRIPANNTMTVNKCIPKPVIIY